MFRITLEQWRMFKSVVDYGGFNQAALAIRKSQSSIHNAVNKIESQLGVKLFFIKGRRTLLTDSGELMLRRANYLLDEAAKLEAIATNLANGVESSLKIAVDEMFPFKLLYEILNRVSEGFPQLRVEIVESVLSGATELIRNNSVDIAISPYPIENMFSEELCQIDFIAVAAKNHPLNKIDGHISFDDLKPHRQIVVRDSAKTNKSDEGWLGSDERWTISHLKTSVVMILQELGFAWLPLSLIKNELESGALKPLNLDAGYLRKSKLYLLSNDNDCLGPAARFLISEFRFHCNNLLNVKNFIGV